ncbi:MAG: DUF3127 domain-containing protein [Cyclobacteriaceae bacterium]|nr:DUF3127 domain-containing protein [Cyclobacteriaceae bacterium]
MELKAKILEISNTMQVTNSFQKREFVVEYAENPTYPEYLKFEVIQDRCQILDGINPGEEITIHFNLKGRKWTDKNGEVKYFNSLQAWKIDKSVESDMNQDIPYPEIPPEAIESQTDDDLPF